MVLRSLSIFGFKSFADKTEIRFGEGMTAVIGPNGCGKSNVVDAIRWVFGEQRASMLRSSAMNDVIFSGSEKRQPLNMAEVTIVIANSKGILPIEFSEVAITRRIFRSGDSEYLINKVPSRLKDIQDMFLDTGIGTSAYTTIENGMINRILSDKAEERRMLFEEAAGIGKYKHRIKESQRKLEKTRQDLLRIADRVQEKERYVRMLSRQVEKANRYKQYFDDLRRLEVGYENRRFITLRDACNQRKRQLEELNAGIEVLHAKIAASDSRIQKTEVEKLEKEHEVQIAGKNVADTSEQINSLDREISVIQQSLTYLAQNISRFEQEISGFETQANEKQELLTNLEKCLIGRESEIHEFNQKVENAKAELREFDIRVSNEREKADELSMQQLELVNGIGDKKKELGNCQTNLVNSISRCERDEAEMKQLEDRLEETQGLVENSTMQLSTITETFKNLMQTRQMLTNRIDHEDGLFRQLMEKEKRLEASIDASKAKLRFLEGLDASFEGYGQGVKALCAKRLPGTVGIVADLMDVENDTIVKLIEKSLDTTIQTVVFKTDAALTSAIDYLKQEKLGVAPMISLEFLGRGGSHNTNIQMQINEHNNTSPLLSSIRAKNEFNPVIRHLFDDFIVCNSDEESLLLQGRCTKTIISSNGNMFYPHGTVIAGAKKKEQVGILQRKQEIEKLKAAIPQAQKEYNEVVSQKEICIINRDESKRALVEIDEKLNSGRQKQQEHTTNIRHYENELSAIREKMVRISTELTASRNQIESLEKQIAVHETELQELTVKKSDLEGCLESIKSRCTEMESQRSDYSERVQDSELLRQGFKNRIEQDRRSIEQLKADIKRLNESKNKKHGDRNSTTTEIKNLEQKLGLSQQTLEKKIESRQQLQVVYEGKREVYASILQTLEGIRRDIRQYQGELEILSNQKHDLDVGQTRDEEQQRSIREKIYTAYEIDLLSPPPDVPLLDTEDSETNENIHMLKERLRRVGEVNLGAIKEYEQESGELHQMVTQRDDLQSAVDELENAIRKLNREARAQFCATFDQVRATFIEMFTSLFEGGEAFLELEENVDPLEAAIKIDVRPAGKKMRGVTLLSGGERALTAISLLFALYMVKPSAYCILDELDAPLDDANVGRFVRMLKKFAESTQFIIITHNKRTMEAADILYGVTQQESGISTIASVRLTDIYQAAAA